MAGSRPIYVAVSSQTRRSFSVRPAEPEAKHGRSQQEPPASRDDEPQFDNDGNHEELQRQCLLSPQQQLLEDDLNSYLELLPHFQGSVNAMLDAEYNSSPWPALDLVQYYRERSELLEYTLEMELPRMDYTIQLDSTTILNNKTPGDTIDMAASVRQHLMKHDMDAAVADCHETLLRAANQSLLADCLKVLTGPDCIIRPEFMATAVATSCHFLVDLAGKGDDDEGKGTNQELNGETYCQAPSIKATVDLSLHLPTPTGPWKVADMTVVAKFTLPLDPWSLPSINYSLESIRPSVAKGECCWQSKVRSTVLYLTHLEVMSAMLPPVCSGNELDEYNTAMPPGAASQKRKSTTTTMSSSWFWGRRSSSSSSSSLASSIGSLRSLRGVLAA